jgi:hypothetical protein
MREAPPSRYSALLAMSGVPVALAAAATGLAGALAAGTPLLSPLPYLIGFGALFLFAAGSLFARYFDRAAAARRLPHRPPPDDGVRDRTIWASAWALLFLGILLPWTAGSGSLLAAIGVALLTVLHGAWLKDVWGPGFLAFGAAYGLTFILGLSAQEEGILRMGTAALPAALHAVGWSLLRAVRQPGAPPATGFAALLHLVAAFSTLLFLATSRFSYPLEAMPFAAALAALTFPRLVRAVLQPQPAAVLEAVQHGLLGLPMLAAALAAGSAGAGAGIVAALLCLPLFHALAKWPVPLVTEPR